MPPWRTCERAIITALACEASQAKLVADDLSGSAAACCARYAIVEYWTRYDPGSKGSAALLIDDGARCTD
jgi:hypothetical protein